MTLAFRIGHYSIRTAQSADDVLACQRLRHLCFFGAAGVDRDRFDPLCDHMMVFDDETGTLVCSFRMMTLANGADIHLSYAAQGYDLNGLSGFEDPMIEIGRFCCDPTILSPDVLRVAWASLYRMVDAQNVRMLFGCSSFAGTDPGAYAAAFGTLAARHTGPAAVAPARKAPEVVPLGDFISDPRAAIAQMPPLLKTYLGMGGWVSDHAVIDRTMNTMHVFTGLFTKDVPPPRVKALRAVAQTH